MKLELEVSDPVHLATGFATGLLNAYSPIIALQGLLLFLWYQLLEQLRVGDMSYIDTLEYAIGWGAGVLTAMLI